jgi:DNA-binding transcriptional LysR family regulator
VGASFGGLIQAVSAGLGVGCWARRLLLGAGVQVLDNSPRLPRVQDVVGGVYLREGAESAPLIELADRIAKAVEGTRV